MLLMVRNVQIYNSGNLSESRKSHGSMAVNRRKVS